MKSERRSLKIAAIATAIMFGLTLVGNQNVLPVRVEAEPHLENYAPYTYSGSYYKDIDFNATGGMNGALRTSLTNLIIPKAFYTYSSNGETHLSTQLQYADEDPTNDDNMVFLYTRNSVPKTNATVNGNIIWNREHVWCQSLSNGNWGTDEGGTDILHLRPAYESTNKSRGNTPYGNSGKKTTKTYNNMLFGYTGNGYFEPVDAAKGDIARIIMYTWTTYTGYKNYNPLNILSVFQSYDTLLSWHTMDKPDAMEGNRNNYAQTSRQKNRNPYVDHPELAWKIFGNEVSSSVKNACMQAYPAEGGSGDINPTGISLNKSSASLNAGKTLQLSAILEPNGAIGNITWSTNNASAAIVDNNGLVTAVAAGAATITATVGSYSASCVVTVSEASINYGTLENQITVSDAIEIIDQAGNNHTAQPLYVKGIVSSNEAYSSEYKNYYHVWLKNDDNIADSFQLFKAKADNSITSAYASEDALKDYQITVYGYGQKYNNTYELTSSNGLNPANPQILEVKAPDATAIDLDIYEKELDIGDTFTLTASLTPSNSGSSYTWESNDESVATVENGVVTAVGEGSAIITARVSEDIEAECHVTVISNIVTTLEVATSISAGDTVYLTSNAVSMQYNGPSSTSTIYGLGEEFNQKPDVNGLALEVEEGNSENTYSFKVLSGDKENEYLSWTSGNSLRTNATKNDNSSWLVSFDNDGNATIANAADNTRIIWWNVTYPRFACYSGASEGNSYKCTQLWKIAADSPKNHLSSGNSYATIHGNESSSSEEVTITKLISAMSGTTVNETKVPNMSLDSTISVSVNPDGNNGKVYSNGAEWRLYQTNSAVIDVTANNGSLIKSVTFTYSVTNGGVLKYGDDTLSSNVPVSINNLSSVSFTVANSGSATNGQVRITSISVTYDKVTTSVSGLFMRFCASISYEDWQFIDENWGITDYGIMLLRKDTLDSYENLSSLEDVYNEGGEYRDNLTIINKKSGTRPTLKNNVYTFKAKVDSITINDYDISIQAAPFILAGGQYYFLEEIHFSARELATSYIGTGNSSLSDAALRTISTSQGA